MRDSREQFDTRELFLRKLDGTISPDQLEALEAMMLSDQQVVQEYLELVTLCSCLNLNSELPGMHESQQAPESDSTGKALGDALEQDLIAAEKAGEIRRRLENERAVKLRTEEILERQERFRFYRQKLRNSQNTSKLAIFTAIASLAAMLFFVFYVKYNPVESQGIPVASVQKCTGSAACDFSEGHLMKPGRYNIVSGRMTVLFDHGAEVTVIGPAGFTLKNADEMSLESGTLVSRVPRRASGFSVLMPSGKVVDLGTEFAVHVDSEGNSQVGVLKGTVSLMAGVGGDVRQTVIMHESDLSFLDSDTLDVSSLDWCRSDLAPMVMSDYEIAVRRSEPRRYWRVADSGGLVLKELISNRVIDDIFDAGQMSVRPAVFDSEYECLGAEFLGSVSAVVSDLNLPNRDYTYSMWVMPYNVGRQEILTCVIKSKAGDFTRNICITEKGKWASYFSNIGSSKGGWVISDSQVAAGHWYNVVVTGSADGKKYLYIDGKPVGQPYNVGPNKGNVTEVIIGGSVKNANDNMQGAIAEIAVYDRQLTSQEVLSLYQKACGN